MITLDFSALLNVMNGNFFAGFCGIFAWAVGLAPAYKAQFQRIF